MTPAVPGAAASPAGDIRRASPVARTCTLLRLLSLRINSCCLGLLLLASPGSALVNGGVFRLRVAVKPLCAHLSIRPSPSIQRPRSAALIRHIS